MSNFIHMLVLRSRDGTLIQRADAISSILEVRGKNSSTIFLILANNVKVEVLGETLNSLLVKLSECGGLPLLLHKDGEALGLEALRDRELAAIAEEPAPVLQEEPA